MAESKDKTTAVPKNYQPRLKAAYGEKIVPEMLKEFGTKSPMALPRLDKIVISVGVNEAKENMQALEQAKEDLAIISGQSPQIRKAKKSISNFKLREGMPIALRVTLRGARMYEFYDRFVSIACPRLRDFQGFKANGFDNEGNYNLGLREHHIFPGINLEKSPRPRGMNITFAMRNAKSGRGKKLLEYMGFPFRKDTKRG